MKSELNKWSEKYKKVINDNLECHSDRFFIMEDMIPKEVKKVLDVGSGSGYGVGGAFFTKYYDTINLDVKNADINQDLNLNQKIPLETNSVDLVILSGILEHLTFWKEIIEESKRVSKKYILINLPNELTLDQRIKYLFGIGCGYSLKGYDPYGHKHFFTIKPIERIVKEFFGDYEDKVYIFRSNGGRFIPKSIRKILANTFPSLFAKEICYLIKLK